MNTRPNILSFFRAPHWASILVMLFSSLLVGETVCSYLEFNNTQLELTENQEEESKTSSEKELDGMCYFSHSVDDDRFTKILKSGKEQHSQISHRLVVSAVDTPPPEVSL